MIKWLSYINIQETTIGVKQEQFQRPKFIHHLLFLKVIWWKMHVYL